MAGMRIAIAQINTIVGDLKGNTEKILFCIRQAREKSADIVVFPELTVTGYPPEDLVLKPYFVKENIKCLNRIKSSAKDIIAVVGFVDADSKGIYNSAGVLVNKKSYIYHKRRLPNYGVFDEKRYFKPGQNALIIGSRDLSFSFSITICEDIWGPEDIIKRQALKEVDFLINISASPYHMHKIKDRRKVLRKKAMSLGMPIVYCNLVGGQDELVFDGRSCLFNKDGKLTRESIPFEEDLMIVDIPVSFKNKIKRKQMRDIALIDYRIKQKKQTFVRQNLVRDINTIEEVYLALVLGLRDYVKKNNFTKVIIGLSGGVDSSLVACIAVDALGSANVLAISMPSRYSSEETQKDAEQICRNLGIRFVRVPINDIFDVYINTLSIHFTGMSPDITEENIQARIRGNILMAFSNKFRYLVLNTGNKSEASVGYCTLYGDMTGGFAVIKDIPKKLVYELASYINERRGREIILKSIVERSPSAELAPGQKDQDVLPPYPLLDEIIDLYIEKNKSFSFIVNRVGDKDVVREVLRMVDMNEYKRRQAPLGIKITPMAFGKDRRMPVTNKFNFMR